MHLVPKTYTIFSFADFVDAKLSLASAHVFLVFQLMMDTLTFRHWPLTSQLHSTYKPQPSSSLLTPSQTAKRAFIEILFIFCNFTDI